jgi:hypothetical protein
MMSGHLALAFIFSYMRKSCRLAKREKLFLTGWTGFGGLELNTAFKNFRTLELSNFRTSPCLVA